MKHYLTLLNILLITAGIYFGVKAFYKTATTQLEYRRFPKTAQQQESSHAEKKTRPLPYYDIIVERNLFKTKAEIAEEPKPPVVEPPKLTKLDLKLWGTVTGPGNSDYAVIQDVKKRKQNLYTVGDTVQHAVIKEISREKIILDVNGKSEILKMEEFRSGKRPVRRSTASKPVQKPTSSAKQNINLNRSLIENAVSDVNNLMRQAKIRPHFRNGKPDGLALSRVRSNSIFRKLGLRSGDVLVGVDGRDIESVDDALTLYENLKTADNVKLQIKRRGQPKTINYNITDR